MYGNAQEWGKVIGTGQSVERNLSLKVATTNRRLNTKQRRAQQRHRTSTTPSHCDVTTPCSLQGHFQRSKANVGNKSPTDGEFDDPVIRVKVVDPR